MNDRRSPIRAGLSGRQHDEPREEEYEQRKSAQCEMVYYNVK